jgi:hypothetical protein
MSLRKASTWETVGREIRGPLLAAASGAILFFVVLFGGRAVLQFAASAILRSVFGDTQYLDGTATNGAAVPANVASVSKLTLPDTARDVYWHVIIAWDATQAYYRFTLSPTDVDPFFQAEGLSPLGCAFTPDPAFSLGPPLYKQPWWTLNDASQLCSSGRARPRRPIQLAAEKTANGDLTVYLYILSAGS